MTMKQILIAGLLALCTTTGYALELSSNEIQHGESLSERHVYQGFGCQGGNTSPALSWKAAPKGTRSFALTLYDPDAPTGSGWWHWVIYNIPASAHSLAANAGDPASGQAPKGSVQSRTDYGTPGFGGACPPAGDKPHRYQFKLFALDVEKLELPAESSAAMVGFMLNAHALDTAVLEATYQR
jgi:Raf kinase inhibitor-like YbhB/YbcL family protein